MTNRCPAPRLDHPSLGVRREPPPQAKAALGQFMTPRPIAEFMAGLFSPPETPVKLLDPGAGAGSLSAAFLDRHGRVPTSVEAWEIDPILRRRLAVTYEGYTQKLSNVEVRIHERDFIEDAVFRLAMGRSPAYTHAIINPPYKKINSDSQHRLLLRKLGVEVVNLYAAFVAVAARLLIDGGEAVAILPRSFCNGTYYRPFREFLLSSCAIEHVHLFESRSQAFKEDDVLQENIIIFLKKTAPQSDVVVSTSHDSSFADYRETAHPFSEIVRPADPERYICIPTTCSPPATADPFMCTLKETGLEVCTGPVVDFRVKRFWCKTPQRNAAPLLYPHHFREGSLSFPKENKKPNAVFLHPMTQKWLMPRGFYVLVKRFSSKEERRRVVAYVLDPDKLPYPFYGFENHWNVFHMKKGGLDAITAFGLAAFLNSTRVDTHFRVFSGHTQVNATDLRTMRYPSRRELEELGLHSRDKRLTQEQIDRLVCEVAAGLISKGSEQSPERGTLS
jgi:adenine-specific DNA-methyltransferase